MTRKTVKEKIIKNSNEMEQAKKSAFRQYVIDNALREFQEKQFLRDRLFAITKGKKIIITYTKADLDKLERMQKSIQYY